MRRRRPRRVVIPTRDLRAVALPDFWCTDDHIWTESAPDYWGTVLATCVVCDKRETRKV